MKAATKPKRESRSLALGNCSLFLAWFEKQAGKPTHDESEYLRLRGETLPALRRALAEKEAELAECERYRTAKEYALYAWIARKGYE